MRRCVNYSRKQGKPVQPAQPVIAIVEDDVSIGRALSRLLHAVGWKAVTFTSAEAFLQTGLQEPPHCLVLDVRLPGMTGFELLEHFAVAGIALPVILITAHDDVQVRMRAARAGVSTYLRKPVDEQDLLQAIRRALGLGASTP